jgi:hypothetical protein
MLEYAQFYVLKVQCLNMILTMQLLNMTLTFEAMVCVSQKYVLGTLSTLSTR